MSRMLEDASYRVYEDEKEMIFASVSTYVLQRQSNKGKQTSNEVVKSPRHHIEHTNSYDKILLTRTFLRCMGWPSCLGKHMEVL